MENNKEITMDALAGMVQKGFEGTDRQLDAIGGDVKELKDHMVQVKGQLDRIEKLLIEEHRRRIEKLENDVITLKDALNIK